MILRFIRPGQETYQRAGQKSRSRTDQEIPRVRDTCQAPYAKNGDESREHTYQRSSGVRTAVEGAQKKKAEQTSEWERCNRQSRFEYRPPGHQAKTHQHQSPE